MELEKEKINRPYTHQRFWINRRTITQFVRRAWARDLRERKVKVIAKSLMEGNHFSEPLTVNEIDDKFYLVNGNHRIESLFRVIKEYPHFMIEVDLIKYTNLSEENEHDLFDRINNTSNIGNLDKIKEHCYESDFFKLIRRDFPCKVIFSSVNKHMRNTIEATKLLSAYINRDAILKAGNFDYDIINSLTQEDYTRIKEFVTFFQKTFGEMHKQNPATNYNFFTMIAKIYYNESSWIGEDSIEKRCKDRMASLLGLAAKYPNGFNEMKLLYGEIINELNKVRGLSRKLLNMIEERQKQKIKTECEKE